MTKLIFDNFVDDNIVEIDGTKYNTDFGGLPILPKNKQSKKIVHSPTCYICQDGQFQECALPLCYPCSRCGGHVPADDSICDVCKYDQQEDIPE